jgi:hypothetical protein
MHNRHLKEKAIYLNKEIIDLLKEYKVKTSNYTNYQDLINALIIYRFLSAQQAAKINSGYQITDEYLFDNIPQNSKAIINALTYIQNKNDKLCSVFSLFLSNQELYDTSLILGLFELIGSVNLDLNHQEYKKIYFYCNVFFKKLTKQKYQANKELAYYVKMMLSKLSFDQKINIYSDNCIVILYHLLEYLGNDTQISFHINDCAKDEYVNTLHKIILSEHDLKNIDIIKGKRASDYDLIIMDDVCDKAYLLEVLNCLNNTGQLALMCKASFLYKSFQLERLRKYLIDHMLISDIYLLAEKYKSAYNDLLIMLSNKAQDRLILHDKKSIGIKKEDILKNDYNLSVNRYFLSEDTSLKDVTALESKLKTIHQKNQNASLNLLKELNEL